VTGAPSAASPQIEEMQTIARSPLPRLMSGLAASMVLVVANRLMFMTLDHSAAVFLAGRH